MSSRSPTAERPDARTRLVIALVLGAVAAGTVWWRQTQSPQFVAADLTWHWRAARVLFLDGDNPYLVLRSPAHTGFQPGWYANPLPAALVGAPLMFAGPATAAALYTAVSVSCFLFALTRDGVWRLLLCLGAPFFRAVFLVQFAPLLAAGLVLAPLQAFAIVKPTLGLAIFAARPSRWAVGGGAVLAAICFALQPTWLGDWLEVVRHNPTGGQYLVPVATPLGVGLLLGLLRWRRSEARLLVAMACVPQAMLVYDQLLLLLVARTRREALALALLSWGPLLLPFPGTRAESYAAFSAGLQPWVLACCYWPALLLILRRPNDGDVPAWLERGLAAARARLRPPARSA